MFLLHNRYALFEFSVIPGDDSAVITLSRPAILLFSNFSTSFD
jgi:hypothetical protein